MIREKIFRLHRHKSSSSSAGTDASGQKFDFTFSNIQANQVPKGWDKVSLSLVSAESSKVVRKTARVPVKNGLCQWTETFSQSIWISNVDSSKELEEYLFKFLVASGSSKSGILGETTLNLAALLSSESPVSVSLPLKKCHYGTILQIEVQCLTPKTNRRDEKWKDLHAARYENADHDNIENQSDISDCATAKSTESFSSNSIGNSVRPRELGSRGTSFSASVSRYSFDSMDDSGGRQSFSSQSERNGGNNGIVRQDSIESNDSSSYSSYSTHGSVKSVRSHQSKHQREELRKLSNATASILQQNGGYSKTYKEADDAMVQELNAEARMWEQNARKLSADVERLRKEMSDQNMNVTSLNTELARSHSECHELTQEIELLKLLSEESSMKQSADQNSEIQDEIRFQKEENKNLSLQFKKTQESNIELISILQEMEETIDKQKLQIESLSMADNHEQIRRENDCVLEIELQKMQKAQQALQGEIMLLESTLKDKIIEIEIEQDLKNRIIKDCVLEYKHRLGAKEEKIMNLEAALSRALLDEKLNESELIGHADVGEEVQQLKGKIQELETDCNKLAEEKLDLLFELNELRKSTESRSVIIEHNADALKRENEIEDLSYQQIDDSVVKCDELRFTNQENNQTELVKHLSDLQEENTYLLQRVSGLEAQLRYLTDKSESGCLDLQNSESKIRILEGQIRRLEEETEFEKLDMKQKLSDMEKQWLEAQEECMALSKLNVQLQATTENIIEEYNSLQQFNGEIRDEKLKLKDQCLVLQSEARKYRYGVQENLVCSDRENKVVLAANKEKVLIMFENITNGGSKCKSIIDELESQIKFSELERLRLAEENSLLRMQLKIVPQLQNEVSALRVSFKEMKSQNRLLEASFKSVSKHYEELIWEKSSMVERISSLQKQVLVAEDCTRKKNALEEKILRLEGDLIARDALCVQNVKMKNELNQIKMANSEFLMKIKYLEGGRKQTRCVEDIHVVSTSEFCPNNRAPVKPQIQVGSKKDSYSTRSQVLVMDSESRIQLLENKLAEALNANDVYKLQLESARAVALKKSESTEEADNEEMEYKMSVVESELQEIRKRYLQISLKYAEVEAQREELVMKLKAFNA